MKCPECRTENFESRSYCRECGAGLNLICSLCSAENQPTDRFCGACGHRLRAADHSEPNAISFSDRLSAVQGYLRSDVSEDIQIRRRNLEGERKRVTVMFCDIAGFTRLSDLLSPEELYGIMGKVYDLLILKVHEFGGTVNEMTGDGILAFFGAPITLEDAPQRAIRSALSIQQELEHFNARERKNMADIPSLKMRIGIHTGSVVVGSLGSDLRMEFKAVGDTVNLASRLEHLATPGSIYVSEEIFKLTEGFFRYEPLGKKKIKGIEIPVSVYRVVAPRTFWTRFDVSAERGLTHFVGREREMELLLDAFKRSKQSRGQVFSIIAEAGLGKSRLLYEFKKSIANEDITYLEGRCLSYRRGDAYYPIVGILKSYFAIQESQAEEEIIKKVREGLDALGADEASTLPYLLDLLLAGGSSLDPAQMSPEARRDRIFETLKRIILKGSEFRPLVLAVEDFHWMDNSSEEAFKYLLDSIPMARVFFIFSYRPDFIPTWPIRSYHHLLHLNRLSDRENLSMVKHILSVDALPISLENFILEKAEGIPFFIEEFIRSLQDLKIIEKENGVILLNRDLQESAIPSTLQDIIMARIDSLPEEARMLLQTSSVIEREFDYELINQLVEISEPKLQKLLSVLNEAELLYENGIPPQSTYYFKHALTREVVYDSILKKKRKRLHERCGNTIESIYRRNLEEYYGILTQHYMSSGNYVKAVEYSAQAGKKAERTVSFISAIEYAKKRLSCLEKLPSTDAVLEKRIGTRTHLGLNYLQFFNLVKAKKTIDPVVDLILQSGNEKRLPQVYTILGSYKFYVEENFSESRSYLIRSYEISKKHYNYSLMVPTATTLGLSYSFDCKFEEASTYFTEGYQIAKEANNLWSMTGLMSALSLCVHYFKGDLDRAYRSGKEAVELAEKNDDVYSRAYASTIFGVSCYGKGMHESAVEHLLDAAHHSTRINYFVLIAIARFFLGLSYFDLGQYKNALDCFHKSIRVLESNSLMPSFANLARIKIAATKIRQGQTDIHIEALLRYPELNNYRILDGWLSRYLFEILFNLDDRHLPEAKHWIDKAIEADGANGMMYHLGIDYALCAQWYAKTGDRQNAAGCMEKADQIFRKCGAGHLVGQTATNVSQPNTVKLTR